MSSHVRYIVGIDVGLKSVGLSAIEVDDSYEDAIGSYPLKLLSTVSVIHDGGVDPDNEKNHSSRKEISGIARRARNMRRRRTARLQKLDCLLESFGFPVQQAKQMTVWAS